MDSQYVVVTGVSSGIGEGIARDLVAQGYKVFGSVRKQADGLRLQAALGAAFVPLHFDVTDSEAIRCAVQLVQDVVGERGLVGLVNNAGINVSGPLMHLPVDEVRWLFEVNVLGAIAVTQAFLPLLGAREGAIHPPGRIVNIGSVSGVVAVPFMGAYAGTKHALEAVTQAFRRELKVYGIEACVIEPGFIRTEMFGKETARNPNARFADTGFGAMWRAFLHSLSEAEKTAADVDVVTTAVRNALSSRKPKTRYALDPLCWLGRLLPDRQFDRLVFKAMGLDKALRG